jgi:hypothetical protein
MTNYYTVDKQNVFVEVITIPTYAPLPSGSLTPPPELNGTEVAQLVGLDWVVLPEYPPEPLPEPPTIQDFIKALTDHLDDTAKQRQYDNRINCALRAGYPGPFHDEGQAFAIWMDNCNALAYTLLAEVQAGTRTLPTTTQSLIDELPPMVWPA